MLQASANIVARIYEGFVSQRTTCSACGTISVVGEAMQTLNLNVLDEGVTVSSLHAALRLFVKPETISEYHCNTCDRQVSFFSYACSRRMVTDIACFWRFLTPC